MQNHEISTYLHYDKRVTNGSRMGDESKAILRQLFTITLIPYYQNTSMVEQSGTVPKSQPRRST